MLEVRRGRVASCDVMLLGRRRMAQQWGYEELTMVLRRAEEKESLKL